MEQAPQTPMKTGCMPKQNIPRGRVCIPVYAGQIAGKVAENVHGGTFGAETRHAAQGQVLIAMRRTSAPESLVEPAFLRSLRSVPRVPGYAGTIP